LIELCVFDLDGTLVNSLDDLANSTNYALEKNGFAPQPVERYRYFVGNGVPLLIKRALGERGTKEAEQAVLRDFNEYYDRHFDDKTRPYKGNTELLHALGIRGVQCGVLSNKPDNFVRLIVSRLLPDSSFAWIQGKTDEFPKKPDPAALEHILRSLGVKKENTLYIGDSDVDIRTGKNAGVATCGVLWGFRGRAELEAAGADHIAAAPEEILALL
jgi:haloacid dehalogenase superfamily, subfamily IA, variant 3 with third motif having DD or ED/haloacid dehalogenase superfamily, subfamily IA, variant 1 with third motif having Dx(3-4)D or Dx(3-4)E